MTTHLGLQRILLPTAQVSSLTTGSITLPSARGQFVEDLVQDSWYNIATTVASGGESSLQVSSIPQTYTHLHVRFHLKDSSTGLSTGSYNTLRFNGDSGASDYSWSRMYGVNNSSSLQAGQSASVSSILVAPGINNANSSNYGPAQMFSVAQMTIYDYANTSKFRSGKITAGFGNNDSAIAYFGQVMNFSYNKTTAISSISLSAWIDTFMAGSYIAVYGIKAAR